MILALAVAAALAGPADDLLAAVDAASNRGDDAHLALTVRTSDADDDTPTERTLEIWQKGTDKRLVRFTEPARLRGVALLVPDGETAYLYLPSYGRARRIVGNARGDAFVGTDFAIEDLARIRWSDDYAPELAAPDRLTLTPRDGVKGASDRVVLQIDKDDHLPRLVEHFDDDGALVRRIRFDDVRDVGGRPLAHRIVVEDIARERVTEASVTSAVFDAGLSDTLFTLSQLTR